MAMMSVWRVQFKNSSKKMVDSDFRSLFQNENYKQIEDVIDARKRLGQYNVYKQTGPLNNRCAYSTFRKPRETVNRVVKFDEASFSFRGGLRHTDSEITVVKIKCTGANFHCGLNKWDMNDIAIPGDGTHLGESPSLVNLATLVRQNGQCEGDDEYLVPLSSWDPFIRCGDSQADMKSHSDSKMNERYFVRVSCTDPNIPCRLDNSGGSIQIESESEEVLAQVRGPSWTGKISKFWRARWRKVKDLYELETPKK